MTQTYNSNETVTESVQLDTRLALQGETRATAIMQGRRVHDRRYQWATGGGVKFPPLSQVDTSPTTPAGAITVGQRDRLTLTVPAGTLPAGRYAFQIAVRHNGDRHLVPDSPRRLRVVDNG